MGNKKRILAPWIVKRAGRGDGIGNEATNGGATLTITNSTVSGNSGSGIANGSGPGNSTVTVSNSTLSGNSATGNGGGIYNVNAGSGTSVKLASTILNAGSSGENIFNDAATVNSVGYNVNGDGGGGLLTGPGDQINTDPMLGPLQDNGGSNFTHALLPGSPAINAGDPNFTPPPFYDQRGPGYPRVVNGRIDIGSFEVGRANPTPRPRPTPAPRP